MIGPGGSAAGESSFAGHLGALLFLTSIFFLNFLARIALAPLAPVIEGDLGLSHAQAGSLFLFISLGYFPGLLGSGFVSCRLGHRLVIVVSALAVGLSLLLSAASSSAGGLGAGLFLMGLGAGLYLPSGLATLTSLVRPQHWGKALAVHEIAPNLSFVLAPLTAAVLLAWLPWRGVLAIMGLVAAGTSLAFWRWGPGGRQLGQAPSLGNLRELLAGPSFWVMLVLFALGIGGSMGVYTMLPLFLVNERGMEPQSANLLIAVSRLVGVGAAFVAGWATDRLGPRKALAAVLALSGATTIMLGLSHGNWLVAGLFLQPLAAVCFFPAGFAALARVGSPSAQGVAVSLTVPMAYILGGGALPAGIGWMGETLSFAWGLGLTGALMFLALGLLPVLRLSARN